MFKHVLLMIFFAAVLPCLGAQADPKNPTGGDTAGQFVVHVRGFWSGQGSATVSANSVQINAVVTDDSGASGTLIVADLPLVDNHFSGTGTLFGKPMTIDGRVDSSDEAVGGKGKGKGKNKDDDIVTAARLGATFISAGHTGRIAGSKGS